MELERSQPGCARVRNELRRAICDGAADVRADLRAHLDECPECRQAFAESREITSALRGALAPEPLSPRVEAEIRARLEARCAGRIVRWTWSRRVAGAAVAAGLLAALFVPWQRNERAAETRTGAAPVVLSEDDAAAIAAGYAMLSWDSPLELSVGQVARRLERVEQIMQRDEPGESRLPWGPEDDWDVPAAKGGSSGTGGLPPAQVARAPRPPVEPDGALS